MNKFEITYFYGPFEEYVIKPEIIRDIAASGMTVMPLHYSTRVNKTALPLLRKYGLRAIVSDPRLSHVYHTGSLSLAEDAVRTVVSDYAEFDNISGWDIVDEPGEDKFPVLSAIVNAFRKYSPDKETVINLFPNYASPKQLGSPDYISHLEAFCNIVKPDILSYDHYHFLGREQRNAVLDNGDIDEREKLIRISAEATEDRKGFFDNIEAVLSAAQKYNIPPMLIILLVEHGPYRNLTRAEILWEVNMCLAYGMKRISYFTYWTPPYDDFWQYRNAMCDTVGNILPHYYDVQAINREIAPVGRFLFDTEPVSVHHIGEPEFGARAFAPYGYIENVEGDMGVISYFKDGSVYLCNRDFRNARTFTITANKPLSYMRDGIFTDLTDSTVKLEAGKAILIRA